MVESYDDQRQIERMVRDELAKLGFRAVVDFLHTPFEHRLRVAALRDDQRFDLDVEVKSPAQFGKEFRIWRDKLRLEPPNWTLTP